MRGTFSRALPPFRLFFKEILSTLLFHYRKPVEEISMSKDKPAEHSKPEQNHPYRPLGLKAVAAAALMLKPNQALKPAG
jgi:hypothetical protein